MFGRCRRVWIVCRREKHEFSIEAVTTSEAKAAEFCTDEFCFYFETQTNGEIGPVTEIYPWRDGDSA